LIWTHYLGVGRTASRALQATKTTVIIRSNRMQIPNNGRPPHRRSTCGMYLMAKLIEKISRPATTPDLVVLTLPTRDWCPSKTSRIAPVCIPLSQQDVIDAILHAYEKSNKQQKWEGPSGLGFNIQGYKTSRGGINTAFPVYRRDQ